ncbi:MAG: alpha,alpha-trehalose-phosphate synthase (UDP-forming), partial [Gemmatimonas sp.]
YSKGLPKRLLAIERLLTTHPEWLERIRLVQVAIPSREALPAYKSVRRDVQELVGRINGRFGTHRWTPIRYINRSVNDTILSALYRAADVMLVTPLRDGMNLVAKEFVATRTDVDGVLVLSEFAGAADELTRAMIVNPYDVDGLAESLHYALRMPAAERRERMQALRAHVMANDVSKWSNRFLAQLASSPA